MWTPLLPTKRALLSLCEHTACLRCAGVRVCAQATGHQNTFQMEACIIMVTINTKGQVTCLTFLCTGVQEMTVCCPGMLVPHPVQDQRGGREETDNLYVERGTTVQSHPTSASLGEEGGAPPPTPCWQGGVFMGYHSESLECTLESGEGLKGLNLTLQLLSLATLCLLHQDAKLQRDWSVLAEFLGVRNATVSPVGQMWPISGSNTAICRGQGNCTRCQGLRAKYISQ